MVFLSWGLVCACFSFETKQLSAAVPERPNNPHSAVAHNAEEGTSLSQLKLHKHCHLKTPVDHGMNPSFLVKNILKIAFRRKRCTD